MAASDYVAELNGESVRGESFGSESEAVFRGLPFARAPTGKLRWQPPQPHKPEPGERAALKFGPACIQNDRLADYYVLIGEPWGVTSEDVPHLGDISEDCLSLNVWTPNWGLESEALPVMVWIHGGSNNVGWGSQTDYDGSNLARQGVVVVTINYRLGIFGFMAHPQLTWESANGSSGNYGLLDQVAALKWVRDNIGTLGGDPGRVTIFGESAGSLDVLTLMASPLADGLYHRVIAQSGAPRAAESTLHQAEDRGREIGFELGRRSIQGMRDVPAEKLLEEGVKHRWGPIHDGWVLPRPVLETFQKGRQHNVPLMIGSTADEYSGLKYYLPKIEQTVEGFNAWADSLGSVAAKLKAAYPVTQDEDVEPTLVQIYTDLNFTCPSRAIALAMSEHARPAFLYLFTRIFEGGDSLGSFHGIDIPYVFNVPIPGITWNQTDAELAKSVMGYWVQFAAAGDPNGDDRPNWPTFSAERSEYLIFGDELDVGRNLRTSKCDALEGFGGR
jgi:para-nitrobenzyl esterase